MPNAAFKPLGDARFAAWPRVLKTPATTLDGRAPAYLGPSQGLIPVRKLGSLRLDKLFPFLPLHRQLPGTNGFAPKNILWPRRLTSP
jgi:hypothetical protein